MFEMHILINIAFIIVIVPLVQTQVALEQQTIMESDKIFGKYCGQLEEMDAPGKTRLYNCHGTVWALDEKRIYITGFNFQPSIYTKENITFWIGPNKEMPRFSDEVVPSENGLYLEPQELALQSVLFQIEKHQLAKKPATRELAPLISLIGVASAKKKQIDSNSTKSTIPLKALKDSNVQSKLSNGTGGKPTQTIPVPAPAPEPQPQPEPEPGASKGAQNTVSALGHNSTGSAIEKGDQQQDNRSLEDCLGNGTCHSEDSANLNETHQIELVIREGVTVKVTRSRYDRPITTTGAYIVENQTSTVNQTHATVTTSVPSTSGTTKSNINRMKPLTWYAGGQPLVLDIPNGRKLSEFHWLAIWDHSKEIPIAALLLPSGPGFAIPQPNLLNGFKPLLSKDVRSGPIEIIDSKTIRVHNFTFEGDAPGAWFYVGKSLIPVASGEIVPIYRENGTFDCDYLDAYQNTTLTLKLPGRMEVTDIFWLSVFCLPYGISFSHIYLPYKDLNVPASMDFEQVPHCAVEQ